MSSLDAPDITRYFEADARRDIDAIVALFTDEAGNALTDDLGNKEYDPIFIGNLLHHFDEKASRDLVERSERALRPGSYLVIEEFHRFQSP